MSTIVVVPNDRDDVVFQRGTPTLERTKYHRMLVNAYVKNLTPEDRDVPTWSSFFAERIINQIVDMHPTGRFITYNEK